MASAAASRPCGPATPRCLGLAATAAPGVNVADMAAGYFFG